MFETQISTSVSKITTKGEYFMTPSEKEIREKEKHTADKIYKPIYSEVKELQKIISVSTYNEKKFLKNPLTQFKTVDAKYKKKSAEIEKKITKRVNKIKSKSARQSKSTDNFSLNFKNDAASYPSFLQVDFLKVPIDETQKKFFKPEFEKQSLEWQKKIRGIIAGIVHSIKNLKIFKNTYKEELQYFSGIVGDTIRKYCEKMAEYNTLKEIAG